MAAKLYGIMMINVQSIELTIVNLRTLKQVERVRSDVALGEDLYNQHVIDYQSVEQVAQALTGFIQIMNDYGVKNYAVWGSRALSAARNADYIQDQLYVKTGLKLKWLSNSEETYLRSEAIATKLPEFNQMTAKPTYLIGINSGSIGISLYNHKNFAFSRNLNLGPVRVAEVLENLQSSVPNYVEVLNDFISSKISDFGRSLPSLPQDSNIVMLGVSPLVRALGADDQDNISVSCTDFQEIYAETINASDQYLMDRFDVTDTEVRLITPQLLLINSLLKLTGAKTIWFSDATVLDGLVVNQAIQHNYLKKDYTNQIITAATNLANRYQVEPAHRELVTKFALHLFDQLKPLHQLGKRDRLLLQVAAIVHDVGSYIDPHEHYMHSEYILKSTEITGLSDTEIQTIAAIARYHSSQVPSEDIRHFEHMGLKQRLTVSKLSAILRLADALDDGRQQKITKISVSIRNPKVIVTAYARDDLYLENWVFSQKAEFFEEVFGLQPVIKRRGIR